MNANPIDLMLRPLSQKEKWEKPVLLALSAAALGWLFMALRLFREGHLLLGTASYGVSWGITVANVIHIIGISHVGIAVSAAVRILRLDRYRDIARMAEVMTLIALALAVVNISLDVGRPERFMLNTLRYGRWHAPMVWSATVISLYFTASTVYLYLSLRRDFWLLSGGDFPLRRVYRWLALGYRDSAWNRERHAKALVWLAVALVPIMVSVHSVYGLFFGLMSAKPGWSNPLQAPYFVLGAVVSGFSALILVVSLLRRLFGWEALIENRIFRAFGALLAFVVFLYLYFTVSEHLTAQYGTLPMERSISSMALTGPYAPLFWTTILGGLLAPFLLLFREAMRRGPVRVWIIVISAGAVNLAMWSKRALLLLPTQAFSALPLPMRETPYRPTFLELGVTLGTYAVGGLLLLAAVKALPFFELPAPAEEEAEKRIEPAVPQPLARRLAAGSILAAGLALVVWGILGRNGEYAAARWILGGVLLATMPLAWCLSGGGAEHPNTGASDSACPGGDA